MADGLVFSLVMLVLVFLGTSVIGGLCGIIALVRLSGLRREIEALTYRLTQVQRRLHEGPVAPEQTPRTEPVEKPYVPPPVAAPVPVPTSAVVSPPLGAIPPLEKPSPVTPAVTPPPSSIPPQRDREDSWELTLGTRWLNWVGIVFVMIAVAFFLKYAYDNNWIGPLGRLGLGTALGVFALGLGEKMRRGDYPILFHTLSGGAIGIFYVCIYFAFQVYTLLPPTAAFYLSILVTGLSVGLGVVHDTRILCIIAQLGGFLSPVLLSTGENRPVALFSYLVILNLTAMGSAFFKQWRDVNWVALAGTGLLYSAWLAKGYDASQLGIALFFATVFYVMFTVIPLLYSLVNREPATAESLRLVIVAVIAAFFNYGYLLAGDSRAALGYVLFGQGLFQLLLYGVWITRCGDDGKTRGSLLVCALAILTAAIPIHFSLDHLPIAWIAQAVMLAYIGTRFEEKILHLGALSALVLALGALLVQLPLHEERVVPVFNRPFQTWLVVIVGGLGVAFLQYRTRTLWRSVPHLALGLSLASLCLLLHMETGLYWDTRVETWGGNAAFAWKWTSLTVLWSLIAAAFTETGHRCRLVPCLSSAYLALGLAAAMLLKGLAVQTTPAWPLLNGYALGKMAILPAIAWLLWRSESFPFSETQRETRQAVASGFEILGHGILVAMGTVEFARFFPEGGWASLVPLGWWTAFAVLYTEILYRRLRPELVFQLLQTGAFLGAAMILLDWLQVAMHPALPVLNPRGGGGVLYLLALGYGVARWREGGPDETKVRNLWEIAGYALLAYLIFAECRDWAQGLQRISPLHSHGLISALWSIEAFGLIYFGLRTGERLRRLAGFFLFGVTIFKVLTVDMSVVQPVYRILSFFATGLFLIIAGFLYQRYAKLLHSSAGESKSDQDEKV